MIQDVLSFAQQQVAQGKAVALVTVTQTNGSSPASAGQFMAVLEDGTSAGTVGGGATEHKTISRAAQAIKNGETIFEFCFNHAESGMVCGGGMRGFGNVIGNENHLYLFGGGHVGQSLARIAEATGFFVTVIEDRPELADAFRGVRYEVCQPQDYEKNIAINGKAYAVICTRGHKTDDDALRFCITKPFEYIGMIGSAKKVDAVFERLYQAGYSKEALSKVYTPIGLDIASTIPAEIAVSILAEILLIKNTGSLSHKRKTGQ